MFFTFSVLVQYFLSCLPLHQTSKLCWVIWMFTNSHAFNVFCLGAAQLFWCANLCCYILHWFPSDIPLLQSVSQCFVITRNQYQCDNTQNCTNCMASKISYSHPAVYSLKSWKSPKDFPNNTQINGCHLNFNILHSTPCF